MGLSRGFALFLSLVSVASAGTIPMNREALLVPSREEWHDIRRVPITLGVMSRCPDALTCEAVFDDVLRRVGYEKVDLALTFIARMNETEPNYGVSCLHGELECAGNIHELCVARHWPKTRDWWAFLQCVNLGGREKVGVLGVSKLCAKSIGIDWKEDGIEQCVQGEEGSMLLKQSLNWTRELGVTKSCTIMINNQVRCIRDGEWKNCEEGHLPEDFERIIEREFRKLNPGIQRVRYDIHY